jgi:hypothetical protein
MSLNIVALRVWPQTVAETCSSTFVNQILGQLVGSKRVYMWQLHVRCTILGLSEEERTRFGSVHGAEFFLYTFTPKQISISQHDSKISVRMVFLGPISSTYGITVLTSVDNSVCVWFTTGNVPGGGGEGEKHSTGCHTCWLRMRILSLSQWVDILPDKTASYGYYRQTIRLRKSV